MNVDPPAVAFVVIKQLLEVFTFDIGFEDWNLDLTVLGEGFETPSHDEILTDIDEENRNNLSTNLEQVGYGSAYMTGNLGSQGLIFAVSLVAITLIIVLWPLEKNLQILHRFRNWLKATFLWNYFLRLFLETGIVLMYCVILTARYGERSG